ncbi:protein altered xyloglucan 4-like [Phtheirospermum japonicum]|uniref:Protein altered xyloglucan 4-like n=1 Tax=Phtheirospermum japonicum TaxID=374723 RepID=A0A830CGS4_9LAMI|nr:protein altered xyloglucan 4-like [Phtheirospermum japonicum]
MALWSPFLVSSTERVVNGSATSSFDLHLDRVDPKWSEKLPLIDYAIFSGAHWFFPRELSLRGRQTRRLRLLPGPQRSRPRAGPSHPKGISGRVPGRQRLQELQEDFQFLEDLFAFAF